MYFPFQLKSDIVMYTTANVEKVPGALTEIA